MTTTSNMDDRHVVVGGDGMIGGAVSRYLAGQGRSFLATTRHHGSGRTYFDILDASASPDMSDSVLHLCVALPSPKKCEVDPAGTARVNVAANIGLAETALRDGAFMILYSTNHVFDGSCPYRKPSEDTCPVIEYGRQKTEIEEWLLAHAAERSAIIRMTKVIGPNLPVFDSWVLEMQAGRPIHPFFDMNFSPLPLEEAVRLSIEIGSKRLSGIHHLSGDRDISYADAAEIAAEAIGAPAELVQPISWRDCDIVPPPPDHTVLAPGPSAERLGFHPPSVEDTIRSMFRKRS